MGFPAYISFPELPWQICIPWVVQDHREIIYRFTAWRPRVQNLGVLRVGCFWKVPGAEGLLRVVWRQVPLILSLTRALDAGESSRTLWRAC